MDLIWRHLRCYKLHQAALHSKRHMHPSSIQTITRPGGLETRRLEYAFRYSFPPKCCVSAEVLSFSALVFLSHKDCCMFCVVLDDLAFKFRAAKVALKSDGVQNLRSGECLLLCTDVLICVMGLWLLSRESWIQLRSRSVLDWPSPKCSFPLERKGLL